MDIQTSTFNFPKNSDLLKEFLKDQSNFKIIKILKPEKDNWLTDKIFDEDIEEGFAIINEKDFMLASFTIRDHYFIMTDPTEEDNVFIKENNQHIDDIIHMFVEEKLNITI